MAIIGILNNESSMLHLRDEAMRIKRIHWSMQTLCSAYLKTKRTYINVGHNNPVGYDTSVRPTLEYGSCSQLAYTRKVHAREHSCALPPEMTMQRHKR